MAKDTKEVVKDTKEVVKGIFVKDTKEVVKDTKEVVKDIFVKDTKEVVKDTVEIPRKDFDSMMARMDKQSKDIELLYKAADKSRLAKAGSEGGEVLIKQVKISKWDNTKSLVIGWKLVTNRCEVVMGKWVEDQSVIVVFDDGSKPITVSLLEFYRRILNKEVADIVGRSEDTDSEGNVVHLLKLELSNGKKLEIQPQFVN